MTDTSQQHHFSADQPIASKKEDLLNRSSFAESLAVSIRNWKQKESLVIALYGQWGSGKSSVKNMMLEYLKESKEACPTIVEFNPWHWAGQEQLAEAFFQEIGIAIGKNDTDGEGKGRAAKWKAYGTYLTLGASLTKSFKTVLPILGIPGTGILDIVSKGLEKASKVAEEGSAGLGTQTEVTDSSLTALKHELSEMLTKIDRPILVIVDDLDRLSSNEIKLMFQLIKANANFPNMVYLLLFQRDIVEKSLKDIAPTNEREFLDKIVQVGFDIPKVEQTRIEKILCKGLDELLNERDAGKHFDNHRWGNIFIPGLRQYFRTLRDVYRFLNTLSFHVSLFINNETFEVNPVDLIALEVLRVFEPEVYKQLSDTKSILTDMHDDSALFESAKDRARSVVESIVENVSEENRSQVREILKQLFPPVEWVFGGHGYGAGFEEQWFRELRVCHPDKFDRYFLFSIPEGDISQADLDIILSLASNREALVTKLNALNEHGLLGVALNRLEAYKQKIDLKYAVPFITALFDIGDKLPIEETGLYGIDTETHALRIIHWYLKEEKDIQNRGKILKEAMESSTGLYLPVMKTSIEDSRHEKRNEPDAFTVDENDLKELKKVCIKKIKNTAKSGALKKHHKMAYILYRWREWESPEVPKKWVKGLVETREGLLSFLTYFLQKSTSQEEGSYVCKTRYYIKLQNIEDFIPVDMIKDKIEQLSIDNLTNQEQKAVDAFKKALKLKEKNKPDDN